MPAINKKKYIVAPSDSREWVLIQSPKGNIVDVELRLINYRYNCIPKKVDCDGIKINCSRMCCYAGCYINVDEIVETSKILDKIKPYLQKDSLKVLKENNDQIYLLDDYDEEEHLYKTRCAPNEWNYDEDEEDEEEDEDEEEEDDEFSFPPKNHCIFLMKNGLCAPHKYYVDNRLNWIKKKFNICTTFPIDLRAKDRTIGFMDEFDEFAFDFVNCLHDDEKKKEKAGTMQILNSMKEIIIDRFSEEWYNALYAFADDFRKGKIDLDYLYSKKN